MQELQALAKKEFDELDDEKASALYTNPELKELRYRYDEINARLALLDLKSTEQRRKQYNLLYTVRSKQLSRKTVLYRRN